MTRGQLGKSFSRGANIRDSDDEVEVQQEEGSSQGYGDEEREDEVNDQEDEEEANPLAVQDPDWAWSVDD